jgi:ribosome-binding protein aMBF1 (putative translation factor)
MRYSAQIRAARALLGWSQGQLARHARVGLATLQRIEQYDGIVKGNFSTVLKIQKALEEAGIRFTEDDAGEVGVRLKKEPDGSLGGGPRGRSRKSPQHGKRK